MRLALAGKMRAARFSDSLQMARQYLEIFEQISHKGARSDILFGAYADGWIGPSLQLQIASSEKARTLDLEIALPPWAPINQVKMLVTQNGLTRGQVIVQRGGSGNASIELPESGGCFDINMTAHFVPVLTALGNDERELSAMLTKCTIASCDGRRVVLFP